jgi:transcriptional regulator with XRE-family HTH domain
MLVVVELLVADDGHGPVVNDRGDGVAGFLAWNLAQVEAENLGGKQRVQGSGLHRLTLADGREHHKLWRYTGIVRAIRKSTMEDRKVHLSEFLRSCRARLAPSQVGLPDRRRRRTPGLRREDVAALAGVSVTWYTWLEQGRAIQVSAEVLERVSETLQLSPTEREYLFALVQNRPPPQKGWRDVEISPAVKRMLDTLNVPAILMTARWDVVAWNRLAVAVFRDYDRIPQDRRNLIRILLIDETIYDPESDEYLEMARRLLAKFRVDFSQSSADDEFIQLIDELTAESDIFRRLWNSPEVRGFSEGVVEYPQHGGLRLEHTSYVPEAMAGLRLVVYAPHDAETVARLSRLAQQSGDN